MKRPKPRLLRINGVTHLMWKRNKADWNWRSLCNSVSRDCRVMPRGRKGQVDCMLCIVVESPWPKV